LDIDGNPVLDGTSVSFSLSSETYGSLSGVTATTANGNGIATTTFTGSSTPGTVTITATSGSVSSTTSLTVVPADTGSITFQSVSPQVVGRQGAGQVETAIIKFLVNDINGNPVTDGTPVEFSLNGPGGGEYIGEPDDGTPKVATAATVSGVASVILSAGTVSGPANVTARTNVNSEDTDTLSADINSVVTTITVSSTAGFPANGRIRINNELIDYTGLTATDFTGCTRGAASTTAAAALSGVTVYGQDTISSAATPISIGGGTPTAKHFTLSLDTVGGSNFNLPGLSYVNGQSTINAWLSDRFGNFNVLEGTSISFYTEAGAIDRQGIADDKGTTSAILRTQNALPEDVTRAMAGDAVSNAYFGGVNEPWYTSGSRTYNPRDGWITVLVSTMGEETFLDENANGNHDRSLNSSACPVGLFTCECDGGVTDGYSSSISSGASCPGGEQRSEAFLDMPDDPFYDNNDDGDRDDGSVAGSPFELFIDIDSDGIYDGTNGRWDGPDCIDPEITGCLISDVIWDDIRLVFTSDVPQYYHLPDATWCYLCTAYSAGEFAVAPASIAKGASGSFTAIIGDLNINRLEPGTTITGNATVGTIKSQTGSPVYDGLSRGPSSFSFIVEIDEAEEETSTDVYVEVTTPTGGITYSSAMATISLVFPAISITTPATLPDGTDATAYSSTTLRATGGNGDYSWAVTAGSLPTGLAMTTAGVISGTPTVAATYNFDVTVTDSQPVTDTATESFTITINP